MENQFTWTTFEVAKFLGVTPQCVRKWRSKGSGPRYYRLGGTRGPCRYVPSEVVSWLEERGAASTSEESAKAQMAAAAGE